MFLINWKPFITQLFEYDKLVWIILYKKVIRLWSGLSVDESERNYYT